MTRPVFVIAQETTLRAAVARLLMADGEHVELADNVKRAREILGRSQARLTIIAPRRLGADGWALAKDLHSTTDRLIVLTDAANGPASLKSRYRAYGPAPAIRWTKHGSSVK